MTQKLLRIDSWYKSNEPGSLPIAKPVPYDGPKPSRVWTWLNDSPVGPGLPAAPVHGVNAFLEDYAHDWNIRGGMFIYRSRVSDRSCWVLLEFDT